MMWVTDEIGRTLVILGERFWSKVDANGDCWLWTASIRRDGYGAFRLNGRTKYAHRLAWEALIGPIPDGRQIDHLCRARRCVNPDHMFYIKRSDTPKNAKFSKEAVLSIRHLIENRGTLTLKELSETINVHYETIRGIKSRRTYVNI